MAIITIPATTFVTVDTDKFTKEEWIEFIKKWVRFNEVEQCMKDLFPFEALKERAIANAKMAMNPLEF